MFPKLMLQIALVVLSISCEMTKERRKDKRERWKHDDPVKSLWKNEYEEELTDAMFNIKKRGNSTRAAQGTSTNENDAVIEKIIESITSSERYLKKVDSIEFRLNRLDIEVHEKTNAILKLLNNISKTLRDDTFSQKMESTMHELVADVNSIKYVVEKNPSQHNRAPNPGEDVTLDTRLTFLEDRLKTVQTGVESVVSTISEVKNRQYSKAFPTKSETTSSLDTRSMINEFRKTLREQKTNKKCDCKNGRVDRMERYPTDCHEIQMQGFNVSGIYKIRPDDMEPFYVLCDLTTAGGGWTVFQNRFDGSQDFYKGWSDYVYGFGNLAGEFWLGLEKLNCLTNQKLYELRIEIETQHGQEAYAGYSVFTVGPEYEGYRISTLGTFYGTAGDSLSYHAGQKFSTFDVDNDEWNDGACAIEHGGAWWYKECDKSHLNGRYSMSSDDNNRGQSIYWVSFKGPISKTKMMIRPLPASKPIDYMKRGRTHIESPQLRPPSDKAITMFKKPVLRTQTIKGKYDVPSRSQYRYHERTAATFFPNYV